MSDSFNGYHVWLGIPPSEQPPNHYRLLGIAAFETDLDVIDHAADRQMAHVRTFQSGRNGGLSQQILNELASARVCLLNAQRKSEYDDTLRAKLSAITVGSVVPMAGAVPVAVAVPIAQPAIATPVLAPPTAVQNKAAAANAGQSNANQSGIHSPVAKAAPVAPPKTGGGPANPSKSGTYAMPPNLQSPAARGAQPGSPSGSSSNLSGISGSSPNLSGVAPVKTAGAAPVRPVGPAPVKPAGATPPPRPSAAGNSAAAKPVAAKPVSATPADDDDPYGLSAASRRPLASRNAAADDDDDDLDDDLAIRHKVGGGVDLSLRSGNRDALVQKLAIYGFVVVAVLVVILVTKTVVERNYGPINELFHQPVVEQPVTTEPKPIHAPAAPLPAPAAGEIVDDGTAAEADPNAADPNATDPNADPNATSPNGDATSSGIGDSNDGIPAVQPGSGLENPADLEAPADLSEPQLEVTPTSPSSN